MQSGSQYISIVTLASLVFHEVIRQSNTRQNHQHFPSHIVNNRTWMWT